MATNKSCWYYDRQLDDKLTCVTLHANSRLVGQDPKNKDDTVKSGNWAEWEKWGPDTDSSGYGLEPLCRSVLTEDFQVNVSNSWSAGGGDLLGGMVNEVLHSAAPYAGLAKDFISKVSQTIEEQQGASEVEEGGEKKKTVVGAVLGGINWAINQVGGTEADGRKFLEVVNSNFVTQGTRFTYYSGTGIDFGNLGMRFTLFPRWNGTEFETVNQQLDKLFPYVIGKYVPFVYKDMDGEEKELQLLGWQKPPAGYRADYKDIDNAPMFGTLKLKIGPYYAIESLVCSSLNFSLSKTMVKKPQGVDYSGVPLSGTVDFSPLYADVNMVLSPATKYSDNTLKNFVYGIGIAGGDNDRAQELQEEMEKSLEKQKGIIQKRYGR